MGKSKNIKINNSKSILIESNDCKVNKVNKKLDNAFKKKQLKLSKDYNTNDEKLFLDSLKQYGLTIKYMDGDGNCLFRSISDQLYGNSQNHIVVRSNIMTYIDNNREYFSLFIEDDESIEDYINRMRSACEWGGHPELYAASQYYNVNIYIHQNITDAPRYILTYDKPKRDIHISYHGECHYNSVRSISDSGDGPAVTINTNVFKSPVGTNSSIKNIHNENKHFDEITTIKNSLPWIPEDVITDTLSRLSLTIDETIEYLSNETSSYDVSSETKDSNNNITTNTRNKTKSSDKQTKHLSKKETRKLKKCKDNSSIDKVVVSHSSAIGITI